MTTTPLWVQLGFDASSAGVRPSPASWIAERSPSLLALHKVHLCMPNTTALAKSTDRAHRLRNSIATIPMSVGFGDTQDYEHTQESTFFPVNEFFSSQSSWEIRDQHGDLVPMRQGKWMAELDVILI